MAVRKQTGKRLQRVRAFPNFIDWSWKTPEELRQKLGRFEKSLRGMFSDLGDLLLKVVDGTRSPDYTHEGVDTVRFVGTGVSLAKTREGYVTVTITDTDTVVDDHGALNGLADDDHTQYLLVDGTRALGGNWSLGNFNLSNANELTFNGAGSFINNLAQLDFLASGGGFVRFLDTLTMFDSGSYIDGNDGQLRDFSRLDRATGVLAIEAEGGDVTVDASDDIFLRPDDALVGQVGGTFQVTAGGAITLFNSGANNVSLTAGSALDFNGATLDVDTTGGAEIDAGSDIHIRGTRLNLVASSGDIDLTASRVDFNNNPAERVEHVQFINERAVEADASGTGDAVSSYNGVVHSVRSSTYDYVIDHPVLVYSQAANEGATVNTQIDTTDIAGKDLSNGTIEFESKIFFIQSGTGDDAYSEVCRYNYYRARDTGSASITDGSDSYGARAGNWNFGSFSHPNTLTISGANDELVTFSVTLPGGAGAGHLLWIIRATGVTV